MTTSTLAPTARRTVGLPTLTAMVIGSMVGAGVFSLPSTFGSVTGGTGALIAWAVAGSGTLMLALVFQRLAVARPTLDAGVFAYAKAGFGDFAGFLSGFGYWASACMGNVAYWVLIKETLGKVWPGLERFDAVPALVLASGALWFFYWLVRRGVTEAAGVNTVVTIAKVVPIVVFLVIGVFFFDPAVFAANLAGDPDKSLFAQVSGTMLVTVFVFLGVEGASVYSRLARRRRDVGRATVGGFLAVLAVFASVTMVSYGIVPRARLAEMGEPSMGLVLGDVVGRWGEVFIGVGLVVAVLGAALAWSLMAAEVLARTATEGVVPAAIGRPDARGVPVHAVTLSSVLVQVVLLTTLFSQDAFLFAISLCSTLALLPYLFAAGYAVRVSRADGGRRADLLVAALATAYSVFLILVAGPKYLLLACLIYLPGLWLFARARRQAGRPAVRGPVEWTLLATLVAGAAAAVAGLAGGWLRI